MSPVQLEQTHSIFPSECSWCGVESAGSTLYSVRASCRLPAAAPMGQPSSVASSRPQRADVTSISFLLPDILHGNGTRTWSRKQFSEDTTTSPFLCSYVTPAPAPRSFCPLVIKSANIEDCPRLVSAVGVANVGGAALWRHHDTEAVMSSTHFLVTFICI